MRARAIHVGVDLAREDGPHGATRSAIAEDAVDRTAQICRRAGVTDQRTLLGTQATRAALIDALQSASRELAHDGLLVLAFAGRTQRDDGALETSRWCLADGGLALGELADQLALLPPAARLIVIAQTCHATAIARCLRGPQLAVVIASCGDDGRGMPPAVSAPGWGCGSIDQATIQRARSELLVRLEHLLFLPDRRPSLAEVERALEADMPDGERPAVWTNVIDWWAASALDIFTNTA